ncbi:regulator [Martelella alba]|uniref:Regulator n=1 Tax=Martelella alba TaxID=2590451 RepID=A0ABY2SF79_9HYPH|nr:regulator [Martelella alba]TKI03548.1 regulator [Martelella alba]
MATDIQRIESMLTILRDMKSDMKRLQKLSEMDYRDMTPKQCQKRNADAGWIAMAQIKRRHELHALSVELGFAEKRESYFEFELTDGWHRFNHKPREPFTDQTYC